MYLHLSVPPESTPQYINYFHMYSESKSIQQRHIYQVIEQAKYAWMNGDADKFSSLFSVDGEMIVPGKKWQGREAIHKAFTEFTAQNLAVTIEVHRVFIQDHTAVVEWSWQESDRITQKISLAEDVIIIDFENHLIRRWREYIDNLG